MRTFIGTTTQRSVSSPDLAADVPVGEPDDQPVLGGVVLVLVLNDQAFAGEEVRFPLLLSRKKYHEFIRAVMKFNHEFD